MDIEFELRGVCAVPEGTIAVPGIANHFQLPGGQVISIQSVVEMTSGPDADDHRDLGNAEACGLAVYLELVERTVVLADGESAP